MLIYLRDIFSLINPFQLKYRVLFYGGKGYNFFSFSDLSKFGDYLVIGITADISFDSEPILSFVLKKV